MKIASTKHIATKHPWLLAAALVMATALCEANNENVISATAYKANDYSNNKRPALNQVTRSQQSLPGNCCFPAAQQDTAHHQNTVLILMKIRPVAIEDRAPKVISF